MGIQKRTSEQSAAPAVLEKTNHGKPRPMKAKGKKAETVTKSELAAVPSHDLDTKNDIPNELADAENEIKTHFRQLTPNNQHFYTLVLRGKRHNAAYRASRGRPDPIDDDESDRRAATRILSTNIHILAISAAMEKKRERLIYLIEETYENGMHAIKPVFSKDSDGQPEHVEDIPDHAVRIKAAEAAAKLIGANAADKVDHSGTIVSQIIQVNIPSKKNIG